MQRKMVIQICLNCKKQFSVRDSAVKRGGGKNCSKSCATTYKWINSVKTLPEEIFYKNISYPDHSDGCWQYKVLDMKGYGQLKVNRKTYRASRFSWEIHIGNIPEGFLICHRCDNPCCVNPGHLFLGTSADNHKDMMQKGRQVPPIGSKAHSAKLNESLVKDIKIRMKEEFKFSNKELASIYNVSSPTISGIRHNKTWRHVIIDGI